jgi:hypothetical protein
MADEASVANGAPSRSQDSASSHSTTSKFKMFSFAASPSLLGSGFRVLNVFRVFNVISLVTNMCAIWAMIVMTGMTNNFFFFDAASHFFVFSINLFLTASEMQFWKLSVYFDNVWPVFGESHSFVWLGVAMIATGCDTLGNLNKPQFSIQALGLPIWRLVLAAGILSITFGLANIILSLVFRDGKNGITARMIRKDGNLAQSKADAKNSADYYSDHNSSSMGYSAHVSSPAVESRMNRVTQLFKKSPFAGRSKPEISKPIPHNGDIENSAADRYAARSPIAPNVERPPTALHPSNRSSNEFRSDGFNPRYTRYSARGSNPFTTQMV